MKELLRQKNFTELQNFILSNYTNQKQTDDIIVFLTLMLQRGYSDKVVAIARNLLNVKVKFNLLMLLGKAERLNGNYDAAHNIYKQALAIEPDSVEVIFSLGVVCQKQGNTNDAIGYFKRVIEIKKDLPEAFYNLGNIYRRLNEFKQAEKYYKKCLIFSHDNYECFYNLGVVLEKQLKYEEAMLNYNSAISTQPDFVDAHWNKALLLLLLGNYKEGWEEYEWRLKMKKHQRPDLPFKYWHGESLNGRKILIYDEQGFGDTFHFMRFIPLLKNKYSVEIDFECKKEIYSLLQKRKNFNDIYLRDERQYSKNEFDYKVSLLSLPFLLNVCTEDICISKPYIEIELGKASLPTSETDKLKLGIVWSGNPEHQNDKYRSIKVEQLISIFNNQQLQIYSLQKQKGNDAKIEQLLQTYNVIDLNDQINNFYDTAAIISQLDLVITVDTSVAHLSGAMMKPVWIMLPANPDWRWGLTGGTTAWYPTAKLFRQEILGNWNKVLQKILDELKKIQSAKSGINFANKLETANNYFNQLKYNKAAEVFESISNKNDSNETVHNNLAICYQMMGQYNDAVTQSKKAIKINKNYLSAYNTLAINYYSLGQKSMAIEILNSALKINHSDKITLFNLANLYHRSEDFISAEKYYNQAYNIGDQSAELIYNYALLSIEQNNYETAKSIVDVGLNKYPAEASLLFLSGNIAKNFEYFENAKELYTKAIEQQPNYFDAYLNLAQVFYLQHNFSEAEKIYSLLATNNIKDAKIDYSLGVLLLEKNEYDIAERYFEKAISMNPKKPDFHVALAEVLFSKGNYKEGWKEFEWRFKRKEYQNKKIILPNKLDDLHNKNILIYEEQGIGDTFQFIRFVKKIKTNDNKITFDVRNEIKDLISELDYIDLVVNKNFVSDKFDYMFPLLSIAKFFVHGIQDIEQTEKYITVKNGSNNLNVNIKNEKKLNVGICWRGNRFPVHNRKRHAEVTDFEKLFETDSVMFFSLQKDITKDEKTVLHNYENVIDLSSQLNNFKSTALFCSQMDLIISIDTAVLHLAAAMGKEVWALLPFSPDWRWQIDFNKTPWYSTMKLFRQKSIYKWSDIFDNVNNKLGIYVKSI